MAKVVIGIHGLGNKPSKELLKSWWKKALQEGFSRIGESAYFFKFEMVYWADILHPAPLQPDDLSEPYFPVPYKKPPVKGPLRKKVLEYIEKQLDRLYLKEDRSIGISKITDKIIHRYFNDLEIYYSAAGDPHPKDEIRKRLYDLLRKHRHDDILLIAHSMGSIVSYDVLTGHGREVGIDTFITVGSPLGIPIVMEKIAVEQKVDLHKQKSLRTPENIERGWYNFSDLHDKVAFNYNLSDDYQANNSRITPVDTVVYNDYEIDGERNPHKSFGYLRTPELSRVVFDFLTRDESRFFVLIRKIAAFFWRNYEP